MYIKPTGIANTKMAFAKLVSNEASLKVMGIEILMVIKRQIKASIDWQIKIVKNK